MRLKESSHVNSRSTNSQGEYTHMLMQNLGKSKVAAALAAVLLMIFVASSVASAHYNASWRWKANLSNGGSRVDWNSAFSDNQTNYSMFPSDTRQRLRNSYYQWDDALNPGSNLTIEESWASSGLEHETHPVNFDALGYDDIPGRFSRSPSSGSTVNYAVSWLNTAWDFNTNANNIDEREADVQTVAVHEFGHPTGFNHPCISFYVNDCDTTTVMAIIRDGTKRILTQHDRASLAEKY